MPKAAIDGLEMYYELDDDGAPLVLLGGLTCDHTAWMPHLADFRAAGYRCLAFDNRDTGQTGQSDQPYTISRMADDTVGLMDALAIAQAHFLGFSMGGMIAQEIALRHPDRASSITLVCTAATCDPVLGGIIRAWRSLRPALSADELALTLTPWLFTHRFFQRPEALDEFGQLVRSNPFPQTVEGFKRQCDAVLSHDAGERLRSLDLPTHVIVGSEDVLTPPRNARELGSLISGARLTEMPGAGHGIFWEIVPEFNRAVIAFLDEQRG